MANDNVVKIPSLPKDFYSIAAEQSVLGSLLMDNSVYQKIKDIVNEAHFHKQQHRIIYRAILQAMARHGSADLITVNQVLDESKCSNDAGGIEYLASLYDLTPTSANAQAYARIVREKYEKRTASEKLSNALSMLSSGHEISEALAEIEGIDGSTITNRKLFTPIGELLKSRRCVTWLIRDFLPIASTCMIYGESGAGKSFLMLDMALHIATGTAWNGNRTKQGAVFYVAGEGQNGLTARCIAWSLYHEIEIAYAPFYITDGAIIPTNKEELDDLMSSITAWIDEKDPMPSLIVFDTLARCFNGDENSAQDAGDYVKAMDALRKRFNACVVSVHHTGKDPTRGGRGSSAFRGAWEAEHTLAVNDGIRSLHCTKMKDGKEPDDIFFRLETQATNWHDDDDEIIYSAVMVASEDAKPSQPNTRLDLASQNVLTAIHKAIEQYGIDCPESVKELFGFEPKKCPTKVVHIDDVRPIAYPFFNTEDKNKRQTLKRIMDKLEKYHKSMFFNNYVWIC